MAQLSAVRWYGGKHAMAKQIINLMPMHKVYVEVFGGGGHVILNKKRSHLEIYNDINKGLVSLFSVLRDKELTNELRDKLQLTLYSREEFEQARVKWKDELDILEKLRKDLDKKLKKKDINTDVYLDKVVEISGRYDKAIVETARMFYILCQQSFSSMLESWSPDKRARGRLSPAVKRWLNGIDKNLTKVVERFRTVQVENSSYEYILEKYDSKHTLFYLDPPYIHDTRGKSARDVYMYEMENSMHVDLVDRLVKLKGKFILSGYDHPIYDRLDDGEKFFKVKLDDFAKSCQLKSGEKKDRGEEFLWINFKPGTF